jgi:hypothetical protein
MQAEMEAMESNADYLEISSDRECLVFALGIVLTPITESIHHD